MSKYLSLGAVDKDGKYLYPFLPTINVGTNTKPILIPPQLIIIAPGQNISRKLTPDMTAKVIKYAAVRPQDRFEFLANGDTDQGISAIEAMRRDVEVQNFGLNSVEKEPMVVAARLLPQPKLRYGQNKVVDPGLSGGWNIDRPQQQFVIPPPKAYV